MAKHAKHVAKHRLPARRAAAPRRALRTGVVLGSIAVAATGAAVLSGLDPTAPGDSALSANARLATADVSGRVADRVTEPGQPPVSRSDRRADGDPAQEAALDQQPGGTVAGRKELADAEPREIGRALLAAYGFGDDQWDCLDRLFTSESNWRVDAANPRSSAYGIPQALTGLHDLPADYRTNPETQIRWGLEYIQRRYGTPCSAWSFKRGRNWY